MVHLETDSWPDRISALGKSFEDITYEAVKYWDYIDDDHFYSDYRSEAIYEKISVDLKRKWKK